MIGSLFDMIVRWSILFVDFLRIWIVSYPRLSWLDGRSVSREHHRILLTFMHRRAFCIAPEQALLSDPNFQLMFCIGTWTHTLHETTLLSKTHSERDMSGPVDSLSNSHCFTFQLLGSSHQAEFVYKYDIASHGYVIDGRLDRHECMMSASASTLLTSVRK
jgi:hypothetical protein